jgi:diguanylate cyclase (GGDEF)-like protein
MAASDHNPRSDRLQPDAGEFPTAAAMSDRLQEEISRAERFGTRLSCLVVVIENLEQMAHDHGGELRDQAIDYIAGALRRELRRFDRVGRIGWDGGEEQEPCRDLLIVLPGADGPRGEIVARRALERVHTIKIEAGGTRQPLEISVGLAAWQGDVSAEAMVGHARAAMRGVNGEQGPADPSAHPLPHPPTGPSARDSATPSAGQPPEPTTARTRAGGP